ncbi:hypothetical protein KIN20_006603 [Parelaphostrongylus tenuis]|uniref:Uncharacterized protein n=1 Tax=Parelaphostrongylus tenuis TaxID=148309 RepID=A0AAD5M6C3_PARTN|nr:hypothetical protein KIN20_006603 [Parelaphostrongylus tenuis]
MPLRETCGAIVLTRPLSTKLSIIGWRTQSSDLVSCEQVESDLNLQHFSRCFKLRGDDLNNPVKTWQPLGLEDQKKGCECE